MLFVDLVGSDRPRGTARLEDVQPSLEPYYSRRRGEPSARRHGREVHRRRRGRDLRRSRWHTGRAEPAVGAAFAILEALAAANESRADLDLHVRVAVTTGEAIVMLDVGPDTGETFASGDVVNTAAQLRTRSSCRRDRGRGGEVPGEPRARSTTNRSRPSLPRARSRRCPVLAGARGRDRAAARTGAAGDPIPLVGRRRELAALTAALDEARKRRVSRTVTLVGAPGIGKSRLTRELFRHIDRQPELIRVARGALAPYGRGVAFSALDEIVKAEAGIRESHDREAARAKLREAVDGVITNGRRGGLGRAPPRRARRARRGARQRATAARRHSLPGAGSSSSRRASSKRACVRGPALGRRRPARLH